MKKIILNKETVRGLEAGMMDAVHGGVRTAYTCYVTCYCPETRKYCAP